MVHAVFVMLAVRCHSVPKLCLTLLRLHKLWSPRLLCPWDFPGKNTGVGCHFLLQGIFPTWEWNPHLLHWQVGSLPLSHQGSPKLTGAISSLHVVSVRSTDAFFGCATQFTFLSLGICFIYRDLSSFYMFLKN